MATFNINSTKATKLSKLSSNRILLKKIEAFPKSQNVSLLSYPIKVETQFSTELYSYYITLQQFFNNYIPSAKFAATNIPINKVIEYCKFTTLKIDVLDSTYVEYKITFEPIQENILQIYVSETYDGFAFGLSPTSKSIIKSIFPKAIIANNMSISKQTLDDFNSIHGSINLHLLMALTGLGEEEIKFFDYQFVNSANSQILFSSLKTK